MHKRATKGKGGFNGALHTATLLKPVIEHGAGKLSEKDREELKRSVLAAGRMLADSHLPIAERVEAAHQAMASSSKFGPVWASISDELKKLPPGSERGVHELAAISMILGLVLTAVSADATYRKAA